MFTDFPEKFSERKRLYALGKNDERREMTVEDHWPHKGWMVFKFAGVDSMDAAELLIGCELQIPLSERAELEPGATYVSDLLGCKVVDIAAQPNEVGTIRDVEFGTGEAPTLVLNGSSGEEIMIPFAAEYVSRLDVAGKRLEMKLPEGLIEVQTAVRRRESKRAGRKRPRS